MPLRVPSYCPQTRARRRGGVYPLTAMPNCPVISEHNSGKTVSRGRTERSAAKAAASAIRQQCRGQSDSRQARRWLEDLQNVRKWAHELGVEKSLDADGGIVCIQNLFPTCVANATLAALRRIAPSSWELSDDVGEEDDITHAVRQPEDRGVRIPARGIVGVQFWSNDTADGIPEISRALWCLFPSKMPTFSAGL